MHSSELWEIDRIVFRFVQQHHDCSLRDVKLGCTVITQHTAEACLKKLVRGGWVRQKEDSIDHGWVYRENTRVTANGDH